MEMNLHIFTEGQTFCQLRKAISATFKRSTLCNLRSALGGMGQREKKNLLVPKICFRAQGSLPQCQVSDSKSLLRADPSSLM